MNDKQKTTAQTCLEGAEGNTMTFPQIVGILMDAGFEGYAIDFRRATATYYLPDGESIELAAHAVATPVAPTFDTALMQAAIKEAQQQVPGYTYKGFCKKAVSAGCAGYIVSFSGRRALYIGRTAETHVEHFPN
jgi:Phage envelope protein